MSLQEVWHIGVDIIGTAFAIYIVVSLSNLAWFHPDKFEKILVERFKYHPSTVYVSKTYWKTFIWWARLASLLGALALVRAGIEFLLRIMSQIK